MKGARLSSALQYLTVNSLAPGRSSWDFINVIFNLVLLIGVFKSSYDNVLRWMPQDLTGDKSTLVQVMAWCHQATRHYLSQCWPRSLSPSGVTRPQWVKICRSVPFQWWGMTYNANVQYFTSQQNVITPDFCYNMTPYSMILHVTKWCRKYIRFWTHKKHPTSCLHWQNSNAGNMIVSWKGNIEHLGDSM